MANKSHDKAEDSKKRSFKATDELRTNTDAAEYTYIVLGLILLTYISDSFEILHQKLIERQDGYKGVDPEHADDYRVRKFFFVFSNTHCSYLCGPTELSSVRRNVGDAMTVIEKDNHFFESILPKVFAGPNLHRTSHDGFVNLAGSIALGHDIAKDMPGGVNDYFLLRSQQTKVKRIGTSIHSIDS